MHTKKRKKLGKDKLMAPVGDGHAVNFSTTTKSSNVHNLTVFETALQALLKQEQ